MTPPRTEADPLPVLDESEERAAADRPTSSPRPVAGWQAPRIFKSAFVRSVVVLMSGTVAGQAISILASPLITRLYAPADYGMVAVLTSATNVLLVAAALRYEVAIPVARKAVETAQLLALSIGLVLAMSVALTVAVVTLGGPISTLLGMPGIRPHLWFLPVAVLTAGLFNVLRYSAIRSGQFRLIARSRVWQGAGGVAIKIATGLVRGGPLGLLLGTLVSQAAGIGSFGRLAWSEYRRALRKLTFRRVVAVAVEWRRFPLVACPSAVLNSAGLQLTPIILASLYGAQSVGWFSLSLRVVGLPVLILAQALAQVYFGEAAVRARSSPQELERLFSRLALRLFLFGAVLLPLIAVPAPWAFALIFGAEWREAGEYLRILAPMIFAQLVVSPLSQTVFIIGRQDLQLIWDIARLGLVAAVFVTAALLDMTAMAAITAYSGAMLISYIVGFFMYRVALRKYVAAGGP